MDDYEANEALLAGLSRFARGQELDEEMQEVPADPSDKQTIRDKAATLINIMGFPAFMDIFIDPHASHQTKLDAIKQLSVLADVLPKAAQVAVGGTALHVTINAPPGFVMTPLAPPTAPERQMLDITPRVVVVDDLLLPEPEPADAGPQPFAVPDFSALRPKPPTT